MPGIDPTPEHIMKNRRQTILPQDFQTPPTDSTGIRHHTTSELTHAGSTEPRSRGSTAPDACRQNWPAQQRQDPLSQTPPSKTVRTTSADPVPQQLVPHLGQAQSVTDDTVTPHFLQTTVDIYGRSPARAQQATIYADLRAQYARTATNEEANRLTVQADRIAREQAEDEARTLARAAATAREDEEARFAQEAAFKNSEQYIVEYVPQVTAAHTTHPLDTDRESEEDDTIKEWFGLEVEKCDHEKRLTDLSSVAISRISHAAVDMGAEAAAGLQVRDSESWFEGIYDGLFYSASEDVKGLYTEQQTPPGAPLHATDRVLMVADEPAYEVRASTLAGKMIQERIQQVEGQLQQQERLHQLEIQIEKRELAIQQSRYNKTRTGAQDTQADHPQGSTSPQASTLHLSSQPR